MRFLAVYAVVVIHIMGERSAPGLSAENLADQLARFAVPFFFMAGGYFLARRQTSSPAAVIRALAVRLIPMYVCWTLIYLAFSNMPLDALLAPKQLLSTLATGGPGYHLWFLPSYGVCMALVALMARYLRLSRMMLIALALYGAGLLLGSYGGLVMASGQTSAMALAVARGGPFFGTVFVAVGYWLAGGAWRPRAATCVAIFVVGAAVHMAEALLLAAAGMNFFAENDFLLGTLLMGAGAFLLSMTLPEDNRAVTAAAWLGRYALGIYASHLMFILAFRLAHVLPGFWTKAAASVAVLAASVLVTLAIARIRPLRFLVV